MHNSVNKLLRYKQIIDEYKLHTNKGLPMTRIHKKFIYPKFFVSIRTLNTILSTPVEKELKEAGLTVADIAAFQRQHTGQQSSVSTPISNPYLQYSKV